MGNNIFQRFENKYKITQEQFNKLKVLLLEYLKEDQYGLTTIQSLYFDTPTFLLIRRSIEKPNYKEKLRIRGYGIIEKNDNVFFEIKKKYDGIVYKRRIVLKQEETFNFFNNKANVDSQIRKEIYYFNEFYHDLKPRLLMMYDRIAFIKGDLRITIDDNIRFRTDNLDMSCEPVGTRLMPEGELLLEIKSSGAMPLWLVKFFSDNKIYKTSFSKYGEAYKHLVKKEIL